GGSNSVGKRLRLDQTDFTVIGVIDGWRPTPRFYDMNTDRYGELEDVFLPFSTSRDLEMGRSGNMNCWGDSRGDSTALNVPCAWIQYWVELGSDDKQIGRASCRERVEICEDAASENIKVKVNR